MVSQPADIFPALPPLQEVQKTSVAELREDMLKNKPFVVRGFVKDWPLVKAGLKSAKAAREYLLERAVDRPFEVSMGSNEFDGRLFYRDDMSMNVQQGRARLPLIFERIGNVEQEHNPPIVYLSAISTKTYFKGLREDNPIGLEEKRPIESIWIGTKTRIAAHNDFPDNLACVAVGQRRFTVFPPEQFRNLYIGPIDNTPAGRAISMVDFHDPDYEKYPRFEQALKAGFTAVLEPGDAIYIPSLWWHHVEGLSPFNVLMNYWWRETPQFMGAPQNALNHAIMAIRDLPDHEKQNWRDQFDYYVFDASSAVTAHIAEHGRGVLGPMTQQNAGKIRSFLIKMLNNE